MAQKMYTSLFLEGQRRAKKPFHSSERSASEKESGTNSNGHKTLLGHCLQEGGLTVLGQGERETSRSIHLCSCEFSRR